MHQTFKQAVLLSVTLLLISCGSASTIQSENSNSTGNESNYSGENLEGGAVSEVTLDSNNQAVIQFEELSDTAEFTLAVYSFNNSGNTIAFQLGESANQSKQWQLKTLVDTYKEETPPDITQDFHEWLREEEHYLDPQEKIASVSSKALVRKASVGDTRDFKVLSSFSSTNNYKTVTATLIYQTDHFNAYIDQRNVSSLSSSDLENLFEPFNNLIPSEKEIFGTESDVDKDGRFNILLTQQVNELGGSAGGIITGFFYAVDLFSSSQYSQSNETEIFYTFVPDPQGLFGATISKEFALSNILPSVMPHEYQHMINFNMHYFKNGGSPENSFLNEALAHLAEDIYSLDDNGYMQETGIENPARISGYLASVDDLCITCGASLYQRGGGYLLVRYLYEQAEKGNLIGAESGINLINRLLNTGKTGVSNIVYAAYNSTEYETAFKSLMGQFGLALFLSNTGLTTDDRLEFEGINLRDSVNDNRGTILSGPGINSISTFPLAATVAGASISYVRLTADQINSQERSIPLNLSSNANGGVYLIQTKL